MTVKTPSRKVTLSLTIRELATGKEGPNVFDKVKVPETWVWNPDEQAYMIGDKVLADLIAFVEEEARDANLGDDSLFVDDAFDPVTMEWVLKVERV